MNDREKLVELVCEVIQTEACNRHCNHPPCDMASGIADNLIAHGVTIREPGEWIMRGGRRYCSACRERACVTRDREDFWYTAGTAFCPNCGAPMKGESNESMAC